MRIEKKYIVNRYGKVLIFKQEITMKKTALLLGLLSVIGISVAVAEPVPSVNAVGYMQVTLPAAGKLIMVGSPFDPTNSDTSTPRRLLDIFGVNSGLRSSGSRSAVDKVLLWDFANQKYASFALTTNGWFASPVSAGSWSVQTNPIVPRGLGYFLQSSSGSTTSSVITMAGQVPSALTNAITIVGDITSSPLQMLVNPYPVSRSIDSLINTNHGAIGSASRSACDKIILWDTANQKYVTLGLKLPTNRWNYSASNATWTNTIPDLTVSPGDGFWYLSKTNFIWQSDKTYVWP